MKNKHFIFILFLFFLVKSLAAQVKVVTLAIDQTGVEYCINTSLADLNGNLAELYPNPNDGTFTLKIDRTLTEGQVKIVISDQSGKIFYINDCIDPSELADYKISLENIVSGQYFIRIQTGTRLIEQSIIISK